MSAGGGAGAGAFVKDVEAAGFDDEVIARSTEVPVVVDFWASWCGPCRVLGPVLEREVAALGGRVELAKIDTDRNPELAARYGVQGIPAVKAFRDGKVVAEFVGAQPAPAVKAFLAKLAPSPAVEALAKAEAALAAGRAAEAEPLFAALVDDAEAKDRALLGLARAKLGRGVAEGVPELLARIDPRSAASDAIPSLERRLAFFADAAAYGGEQAAAAAVARDPKDLEARYALASAQAARGAMKEALEGFLEVVSRDRKLKDDGARTAMLAIFDALGGEDPLVQEFRRKLQIVL
jgi:putative thioredoxin